MGDARLSSKSSLRLIWLAGEGSRVHIFSAKPVHHEKGFPCCRLALFRPLKGLTNTHC